MQPHTLHGLISIVLFTISFLFTSKKIIYHAVLILASLNVMVFSALGILTITTFTSINVFHFFMFLVVGVAWYFVGERNFYSFVTEVKNRFGV